MATTKLLFRERIRRLLEGTPSTRSRIADGQIDYEVSAFLNKALRMQAFEGFKTGERVPDGAAIATYEGVPVTRRDNGKCRATLPAIPISLPKGMGVLRVYPAGYPELEYIPLTPGLQFALSGNKFLSPLGRKTYTYSNRSITVNSDIVAEGITSLDMELCVTDIASCGDNDILPVSADMEADAVAYVVALLGGGTPIRAEDKQSPAKADVR